MTEVKVPHTRIFDELVPQFGLVGAAVYGVVWRYCQMRDGACRASYETLGAEIGVEKSTVRRHVRKLRDAQYLAQIHNGGNCTSWFIIGEKQIGTEHAPEKGDRQKTRVQVGREPTQREEQVGREHTKETKELNKPDKKPLNATHSRKRRGKPFLNDDLKILFDRFSEVSGIPQPKLEPKTFAAVTKSWKLPLSEMFDLVGSVTDARKLIAQTVREMRAENLTISAPRSIWHNAQSIHGRQQTNGNTSKGLTGMDALKWVHDHAEEPVDG